MSTYVHIVLCAQLVSWGKSHGRLPSSRFPRKMSNDVAMLHGGMKPK